ncbi:MAG: SPASM domain-containing protein [candidate division WOR-3 bacterium]
MSNLNENFDPSYILEMARLAFEEGHLSEALRLYKKAFDYGLSISYVDELFMLSEAFLSKELWREAEACILEVLRVDPDNPKARAGLAQLHSDPLRFCDIHSSDGPRDIQYKKENLILSSVPSVQLFLELTNMCNSRCTTCLNRVMKRERGIMNFDFFKKIVDESSDSLYLEMVHLYGLGESYLVPNIDDYFRYAISKYSRRNTNICLITNGSVTTTLPSQIPFIDISFNAGKKSTYEKITGLDFDKTVSNIWRLEREGQLGPHVNLHMLVFEDNYSEIEDFKKMFAFTSANLVLCYKYDNQCGKIVDKTMPGYREFPRIPCHYVKNTIWVTWSGDVILCCHDVDGEISYGNVKHTSLVDLWYSKVHKEFIKQHQKMSFKKLCKLCNYNKPIVTQNIFVSRKERINLRKKYINFVNDKFIKCHHFSTCPFIKNYIENIDYLEANINRPLIRICSDDERFYGIKNVIDFSNFTFCPELQKLRNTIKNARVTWEAPFFGPSGYAFAARNYLGGLSEIGCKVKAEPIWGDCKIIFEGD